MNPLLGSVIGISKGVQSIPIEAEIILYVETSQLYLGLEGIAKELWNKLDELQPIHYEDFLAYVIDTFKYQSSEIAKLKEFMYVLYEKGAIFQLLEEGNDAQCNGSFHS